jgi:very-short-patch-repair endonuclease
MTNKIIPYEKSFASHEKAQYWSDKNELKPNEVALNSNKKFWFNCNCGHEFDIRPEHINRNLWCPYCSNHKLCKNNNCKKCFEKSFASHEKTQYWSDKNELKPRQIFKNSNNNYLFNCICGHEINLILSGIIRNQWCSYCSNPPNLLCDNDQCNICFEKSFASHEKSKFWSNKNEIKPRKIFKSSNKKFRFNCNCGHEFDSKLSNINNLNRWCPYCTNQKLCDNEHCNICFEKSFASHEKSKFWSNKNKENPRQIFKSTHKKYLFDCNKCNHCFDIPLSCVSGQQHFCSYCANQKLCDNNNCNICFEKSFVSHEKSKFWSNKNKENPRQIFKSTAKKYEFMCEKNHVFTTSLNSISNCNTWCPYCVNKTEQKLYDKLSILYPTLQQQFKVDWCKNKTYLPFDFVIPENKIIIELDGKQHFEQVRNWDDPKKTQENDKYKMKCANNNNYSVIRILQEDVFYDSYDWLSELNDNIIDIIKNKKVQNIYMCKDNEYDVFN